MQLGQHQELVSNKLGQLGDDIMKCGEQLFAAEAVVDSIALLLLQRTRTQPPASPDTDATAATASETCLNIDAEGEMSKMQATVRSACPAQTLPVSPRRTVPSTNCDTDASRRTTTAEFVASRAKLDFLIRGGTASGASATAGSHTSGSIPIELEMMEAVFTPQTETETRAVIAEADPLRGSSPRTHEEDPVCLREVDCGNKSRSDDTYEELTSIELVQPPLISQQVSWDCPCGTAGTVERVELMLAVEAVQSAVARGDQHHEQPHPASEAAVLEPPDLDYGTFGEPTRWWAAKSASGAVTSGLRGRPRDVASYKDGYIVWRPRWPCASLLTIAVSLWDCLPGWKTDLTWH